MTLMTARPPRPDLDQMLLGGLRELDITQDDHDRVVQRYQEFGEVLDDLWAPTLGSNRVFAQGSFMLGTVVRNVNRNDDIDIDIVALRDIARSSITQETLKAEVGAAVHAYARRPAAGSPRVDESERCWTLSWPGMHMDILPAIPDAEVGRDNLLITDKAVREWQHSNPAGYARWFASRSASQLIASGELEEKRLDIAAVPEWRQRTTLQRVVQALKRHRDVFFAEKSGGRPASIVITTLAAHAYSGGSDLHHVLREVIAGMPDRLRRVDGAWALPNPAQAGENFVDSWAAEPWRASNFFEWLTAAESTFNAIETKAGLDQTIPSLEAAFGSRFATGASRGLADYLRGARDTGSLRVRSGGALSVTSAIPAGVPSRPVVGHGFAGGPTH
ncbi:hypothetical protein GCM10010413_10110 [Promicromonospora sukumoe]|uniref:Nucleotidyltransferase n=1 Tax=Promicromonospora sukumoe TaxID=88382 RepID=A0A7W3J5L7_9MICO|nr:nucleotidyltransferase [Promicromonospora sukumoe]MBA8806678.1 hypothetical protein [Promicromonospora sukumoe]